MIQFGSFGDHQIVVRNLGVAPDFACGHQVHLPPWVHSQSGTRRHVVDGKFVFVDMSAQRTRTSRLFLAIYREPSNGFALLEAVDTWIMSLSFDSFMLGVKQRNPGLTLQNMVTATYTTLDNTIQFVVWKDVFPFFRGAHNGAEVLHVDYRFSNDMGPSGDAGNVNDRFLNGTVLNSTGDAALKVRNPDGGHDLTLDMSDMLRPRRVSEDGAVERAGAYSEVWVDFDWQGPTHGDACQPMSDLGAAMSLVADGGKVLIIPSRTAARTSLGNGKKMVLAAPLGEVIIGR